MRSKTHTQAVVARFTDQQVASLDREVLRMRRAFPGLNFTRCDLVRQLTMVGLLQGKARQMREDMGLYRAGPRSRVRRSKGKHRRNP